MKNQTFSKYFTDEVKIMMTSIIEKKIPLRTKDRSGNYRFIPIESFDLYLKDKEMVFYIDDADILSLDSKDVQSDRTDDPDIAVLQKAHSGGVTQKIDTEYQRILDRYKGMSIDERMTSLSEGNRKLKGLSGGASRFTEEVISTTGEVFASAICVSRITFQENIESPHSVNNLTWLVTKTTEMINSLLVLMAEGKASFRDMARLDSIDTGSVTLDHMNRMLLRLISFMFFYNSYFQKYPNEIKKLRAYFKDNFAFYYDKTPYDTENLTLERVFKGGFAPIGSKEIFLDYSLSCLMHDIGKMATVDYHDGNDSFNRIKASRHVFDGYNMLVTSGMFTPGALAMTLLHHDYYGAPYGYNQLKTFQGRFTERRNEKRIAPFAKYFISYNITDVGFNNAVSYFPVKILEILDVFDSMTDKKKQYRKNPFSAEEAVREIRIRFIEGAHLGIDPVIYNIFIDFLKASGILIDPDVINHYKIMS